MKHINKISLFFKLIGESFGFAYSSIVGDKFRSSLSLLGVTVGIFSIIAVFQAVDSLESNIREGFNSFGTDVVYVDKMAWTKEGSIRWWEYRQRPNNTYEEFEFLRKYCTTVDAFGFTVIKSQDLKNGRISLSNATVVGTTYDWIEISPFEIEDGRYFTPQESESAQAIVLIGSKIATDLFPGQNPVGQTFKIGGFTVRVVGVIKKMGNSVVTAIPYDSSVICPLNFMHNFIDFRRTSPNMVLHKKAECSREEFLADIQMNMRNVRRLKPVQKDNFALNEVSVLQDLLGQIFKVLGMAGSIIGGFSILIGAFGIANIMFVSVKERTHIIGIQKAMGAKSRFVMGEFLFESVLLSLVGGILGILLVYILTLILTSAWDFPMTLTFSNVLRGLLISTVVGLIAGVVPAYRAAKLNPVDAINQH